METQQLLPLATILLLGAFHGINPGMGWLFAVALGMQERRMRAVWQALIPLTLGHGLAIGAVVLVAAFAGLAVPSASLKLPVAVTLAALGVYRLVRHAHFAGAGMRVGMRGLTVWSFLMATCHGAGLMVLPVFLGMTATGPRRELSRAGRRFKRRGGRRGCNIRPWRRLPHRDCGSGVAGVRESRGWHPAKSVVQPRCGLGGRADRDRRSDCPAVDAASQDATPSQSHVSA